MRSEEGWLTVRLSRHRQGRVCFRTWPSTHTRKPFKCPSEICHPPLVRSEPHVTKAWFVQTVWDPTNKTHINTVDAVQCRTARFSTGDYRQESSVTAMLDNLQLESLQERRLGVWTFMMFRVVLSSGPLHSPGQATRGHTQRFMQPFRHIKSHSP